MGKPVLISQNNRNRYRKKDKVKYDIDLSLVIYLTSKKPISAVDYPKTTTVIDSLYDVIKAKRARQERLYESKKRELPHKDPELERVSCCLTILSNLNVPTRYITEKLFEEYLDDDRNTIDTLIDRLNTYKVHIKQVLGQSVFSSGKSKDDLAYDYILTRVCNNIYCEILSMDSTAIEFYKDVISFWNSKKIALDNKAYSWNDIYEKYKNASSKPNEIRFVNWFVKEKGYSRSTAQTYLINYNSKDCFTENDLKVITNGKANLFDILTKIKVLTKK